MRCKLRRAFLEKKLDGISMSILVSARKLSTLIPQRSKLVRIKAVAQS